MWWRAAFSRPGSSHWSPARGIGACGNIGIEPSAPRQNNILNPQSVKELQERLGELLPVARAEMESLYEQIAGSGFAVILADTQGAVLSTITDPTLHREFRHAGLSLGALWDERHEGTNGIGTCLAEGCVRDRAS